MRFLDWAIVVAYLTYVICDGIRMTKKSSSAEGYFLASRSLPWWAVGLSVMATQMSAITLVGTTGQGYSDGMKFIQFYYGLPLAMIILCLTVVPFFHRAKVYTAYEYLENRFNVQVRTLTSFFFLISRALGVGVIISAPSIILSIVLGWNLILTIFAIGLSTTVYTMFGGVQAVTWTDVKQMFIIFFGLSICLIVILSSFPSGVSFTDGLYLAGATGRLDTVNTEFNLTEKYTLWSGLIGGLFLMLGYFGCDQSQVQRYLTAKSVNEGRTSLLMSAFLKIPIQFMILLIGVLVFVFYQFNAPPIVFNEVEEAKARQSVQFQVLETDFARKHAEKSKLATEFLNNRNDETKQKFLTANDELKKTRNEAVDYIKKTGNEGFNDINYVFPTFVISNMPMGVIGLVIAAIFAAAMSSIAAELNALATATTIDFYRRLYAPDASDEQTVRVGKISTLIWGLFACIVAIYAANLGSLIEVVNKFGSFFYGSLLGVFVLAFVVKRAKSRGAFFGLLFGISSVWFASIYTNIEFLWFNVIGCLVTVFTGYLISLTVSVDSK
ncbi:MAG: sodium/solute symporter [Pyrinomonadaceae bacterium]